MSVMYFRRPRPFQKILEENAGQLAKVVRPLSFLSRRSWSLIRHIAQMKPSQLKILDTTTETDPSVDELLSSFSQAESVFHSVEKMLQALRMNNVELRVVNDLLRMENEAIKKQLMRSKLLTDE